VAVEPTDADRLWGINSVWEALQQNGRGLEEVLIERGKAGPRLQQIIDLARQVPRHCRHQGVVARQSAAPLLQLEELLDDLEAIAAAVPPRLLALDSIQDPRNLGSILRSALAAGFGHVILTRDRSVPVTGTVARTSAGAVAHLKLCQVVNLAETLKLLKERGFWVFGAVVEPEADSIYQADFSGPVCLVIGSEGKGIRPLVRRQCDHLVTIPMHAPFNSLNASAAAAVLLFEIARRDH
jgi:23S rRNA (guanosine2251-2'-O)-methyltransferase